MTIKVELGTTLLARNDELAAEIRYVCADNGIFLVNIMSSPGAGKTTLLEKTLPKLKNKVRVAIIEGDIATTRDADRISAQGVTAVQLNTDGGCHLDARMIYQALQQLNLAQLDLIIIENIGNLVCPAEFSLGEDLRIALLSTTEGNDKIVKYPLMFREAQILVINKTDLLPYTDFNIKELEHDVLAINPDLQIHYVSARQDTGIDSFAEQLAGFALKKAQRG
ncbi:hydrogenase nickel incorporation protein HypB [Paradesulfitobacterium aromaticivorans]